MIKLRAFGLDGRIDFEAGAYGEDAVERYELVAVAQRRAEARYGVSFDRHDTLIVGDTASDVQAAKRAGARIVAVASGRDTFEQLREVGAEAVLADLTELGQLLGALDQV